MSRRLDDTSRNILEFRPQIEFVEPDIEQGPITPAVDPIKVKDVLAKADETRKLAKAVDTLAAALQNKADLRAKNMVIKLDPNVDAPTIQAMRRAHPGADPTKITYPQYAACKDRQLEKGLALAKQGLVSPEEIEKARQNLDTTSGFDSLFNSEAAKTGGLRPELNTKNQIVQPINMEDFQQTLLEMLVNFLWKTFIKPIIPLPGLPDEIAGNSDQDPSQYAKQIDKVSDSAVTQAENFPNAEKAAQKAAADAGTLKVSSNPTEKAIADAARAAVGDAAPGLTNPLALQDCYAITTTFERGAAYSTTEESVFAMMRPSLNSIRIMAGSQEFRSLADETIRDGALGIDTDADEETTGDDPGVNLNASASAIIEDAGGTGAKAKRSLTEHFTDWLKDCFPCDFRISSAADFAVKFQTNLEEALLQYLRWYQHFLRQLEALANLFNVNSRFAEICAIIKAITSFVCLPDLRRIIAILMLLLMRIAFSINGLFSFILNLVAPLILPFLSGIADTMEKFLLAIVKPIECIIDGLVNMIEKFNYNAIFQKGNIRDLMVNVGPQGREFKSDGISLRAVEPPRIKLDMPGEALDVDVRPEALSIEERQLGSATTYKGAEWGTSFNFAEDTFVGDIMREDEQAVREANEELEAIRARRAEVDFEDEQARRAYLAELEAARKKRNDAVDKQDTVLPQRLRGFLEGFKRDMRSIIISISRYLREAIDAVTALVAAIVGEFRALMASLLGDGDLVISLQFEKLEIIQIIAMMVSFIAWLAAGASCDDPDESEIDVSKFIPTNSDARIIQTNDDGSITITENPALIEEAVNNLASSVGPVPAGSDEPGAEVVGTPADRSRQRLKSLVEFTGNPVLDTEIARVVDSITTPAKETFKCPLQTSVAQAEQVNTWMRELNDAI